MRFIWTNRVSIAGNAAFGSPNWVKVPVETVGIGFCRARKRRSASSVPAPASHPQPPMNTDKPPPCLSVFICVQLWPLQFFRSRPSRLNNSLSPQSLALTHFRTPPPSRATPQIGGPHETHSPTQTSRLPRVARRQPRQRRPLHRPPHPPGQGRLRPKRPPPRLRRLLLRRRPPRRPPGGRLPQGRPRRRLPARQLPGTLRPRAHGRGPANHPPRRPPRSRPLHQLPQ